jgi:hypothetical protein
MILGDDALTGPGYGTQLLVIFRSIAADFVRTSNLQTAGARRFGNRRGVHLIQEKADQQLNGFAHGFLA